MVVTMSGSGVIGRLDPGSVATLVVMHGLYGGGGDDDDDD